MSKHAGSATVLTGILHPCAWDARGAVTALTLATDTEEEYLLRGPSPRSLRPLMGEEVVVRGRVRRDPEGDAVDVLDIRRAEDDGSSFSHNDGYSAALEEVF
ncbi:hypothetical protein M7784_04980 [Desulfovibrio aminophilus]|nr:hypothetical protein [Desulfovibrio aminophilus]MCM0754597.1 hypothetical protein [Desulfovibrio aminophilus]